MQIGSRIFPYPVLNRDPQLSGYKGNAAFRLVFDADENGMPVVVGDNLVFRNLRYELNDKALIDLVDAKKAKGIFILECSAAALRRSFDIFDKPYDLVFPLDRVSGSVSVSCYLFAEKKLHGFKSSGFAPEYRGYSFDLEKHSILAVDDGYRFRADFGPAADAKVESIFSIVPVSDGMDIVSYKNGDRKIEIALPEKFFRAYGIIKNRPELNTVVFSMLAVPALAFCLDELSSKYDDLDNATEEHLWFRSVRDAYTRNSGDVFSLDTLKNEGKFELAQYVLNNAPCNGLLALDELLFKNNGGDENE